MANLMNSTRVATRSAQRTRLVRKMARLVMLALATAIATNAGAQSPECGAAGTVFNQSLITEYAGGFTGQLHSGDFFGQSVASIGDLNGDGVGDLAVGAHQDDDGGANRGAIWILFMNADFTVSSYQKISSTQGGFTGTLDDASLFGVSVTSVGDLDGDGVNDIAVGAQLDDDGGNARGAVWILFLNPNGTVHAHQKISNTEGGFTGELDDSDFFGISVTGLGDLDGDGVGELAVGAARDDDGGEERGAIWVLFMNANGTVRAHQKISSTEGNFTGVLDNNDGFGISCARLGDLDGDGTTELAIGAFEDDDGGTNRGAVWILFLNPAGSVRSSQKISNTQGGFTGPMDDIDLFGISVARLGDLDGDGVTELLAGMYYDDDGGTNRGAVWVLFLNTNGTVRAQQKISQTTGGFSGRLLNFGNFGRSVAVVGDLNTDGRTDIAVGAHSLDAPLNAGEVWILSLNDCSIQPVITQQPTSVLLGIMGGISQFAIVAGGTPALTYQWRRDGVDLLDGASVLGVNTPTLTVVASDAQIGFYDCVVRNPFGSTTSTAAVLGLRAPCPADFNRDGISNSADFFSFLTAFFAGCP